MDRRVREAVWERASDTVWMQPGCEAGTPACTYDASQFHHRQLRSRGGGDTVANGMAVCASCHRWIHEHPGQSQAVGWMVSNRGDPAVVAWLRRGVMYRPGQR